MTALLAFLIGVVAGLRAFMGPAAVSWAAHGGALDPGPVVVGLHGVPLHAVDLHAARRASSSSPTSSPARRAARCRVQFGARLCLGALLRRGDRRQRRHRRWSGPCSASPARSSARSAARRCARGWRRRSAATARRRLIEDAVAIGAALLIAVTWSAAR